MSPLRIVYLWDADYPWDVRTEKICRALTSAGHEVHIVARNSGWKVLEEGRPEATVHRMAPWRYMGPRLDRLLGFPAFFNPRWLNLLSSTVRRIRAELIIARDLPLCPTAIWTGRRMGIPVLFDMAENYPALLQDTWDTDRQHMFDYLVRNPALAKQVERYCLSRVSRVLAVVEESRNRLIAMGVPIERIDIVSNTPSLHRLSQTIPCGIMRRGAPLEIVYLGVMELARGVGLLVEAAARLKALRHPVHFRLIGGGRDLDLFRQLARRLGVLDREVEFTGFVPRTQALDVVARADIGAIPHLANDLANTTIPNKLFDYMAAALPVLTSDAIPCARIVKEAGCGQVFHSGSIDACVAGILVLSDVAVRSRCGAAGRRAIRERYNWEGDTEVLLRAVVSAVAQHSKSR